VKERGKGKERGYRRTDKRDKNAVREKGDKDTKEKEKEGRKVTTAAIGAIRNFRGFDDVAPGIYAGLN
jgi:hypothetical protein